MGRRRLGCAEVTVLAYAAAIPWMAPDYLSAGVPVAMANNCEYEGSGVEMLRGMAAGSILLPAYSR